MRGIGAPTATGDSDGPTGHCGGCLYACVDPDWSVDLLAECVVPRRSYRGKWREWLQTRERRLSEI